MLCQWGLRPELMCMRGLSVGKGLYEEGGCTIRVLPHAGSQEQWQSPGAWTRRLSSRARGITFLGHRRLCPVGSLNSEVGTVGEALISTHWLLRPGHLSGHWHLKAHSLSPCPLQSADSTDTQVPQRASSLTPDCCISFALKWRYVWLSWDTGAVANLMHRPDQRPWTCFTAGSIWIGQGEEFPHSEVIKYWTIPLGDWTSQIPACASLPIDYLREGWIIDKQSRTF
jgi:hypothetical protein